MKITLVSDALEAADVVAVQVYQHDDLTKDKRFATLDKAMEGQLAKTARAENFTGKADQILQLHTLGTLKARVLVLIGAGDAKKATPDQDRLFAANGVRRAVAVRSKSVSLVPAEGSADINARAYAMALGARLASYRFDRYRTKDQKDAPPRVETVAIQLKGAKEKSLDKAKTLAQAVFLARDLINEPASVVNPESFAREARKVAKNAELEIEVLEPRELTKERFGMLLAVGQGSDNPPRVVHLRYKPKKAGSKERIALIGKGVTFDSGGLSLKPSGSMEDMKIDMSGGAAVLAAMSVIPSLDLDFEVHGLIGLVENMPSGKSYRPGDVLTSRKGTTVEVNNTDAEGRLVLGDVIDYAKSKVAPSVIIDLATLTGACMVALGPTTAGLFANDDSLADALLSAAKTTGEDFWRLPLNDSLREQLKSDVADMKNTGDRLGGAITGALFLREFAGETPWAHLDIAGPAASSKDKGILCKGGTGFAVATLIEYLSKIKPQN